MYVERWAWLRNNGVMGTRWEEGDTQSPGADLTGIYGNYNAPHSKSNC